MEQIVPESETWTPALIAGPIIIIQTLQRVLVDDSANRIVKRVLLGKSEYQMLEVLAERLDQVVTFDEFIARLGGMYRTKISLQVCFWRLHRAIGKTNNKALGHFQTHRRLGYCLSSKPRSK